MCKKPTGFQVLIGSSLLAEAKVECPPVHIYTFDIDGTGCLLGLGNDIFGA